MKILRWLEQKSFLGDIIGKYLFVSIPIGISILTAVIICRHRVSNGHRPGVFLALFAAFFGPVCFPFLCGFISDRNQFFTAQYWLGVLKPGALEIIGPIIGIFTAVCLIPTMFIVHRHQKHWLELDASKNAAEQDAAANP